MEMMKEMEKETEERMIAREERMLGMEREIEEKWQQREREQECRMQAMFGKFMEQMMAMCGSAIPSPYMAQQSFPHPSQPLSPPHTQSSTLHLAQPPSPYYLQQTCAFPAPQPPPHQPPYPPLSNRAD